MHAPVSRTARHRNDHERTGLGVRPARAAYRSITALIEHWNGASWSVVSSPRVGHGAFLSAVMAISSNDVWAAGSNNSSGVLMEHWNGTSWSVVSSPAFTNVGPIRGISADASNDVWAIGTATTLHWNGQTWSQVPAPSTFRGNAVTALSPTNVWAAGSRSREHHWKQSRTGMARAGRLSLA